MPHYIPPLFLKTRYRALPGNADAGDHWVGGESPYPEAVCPNCRKPYLLLWDINCYDKRFSKITFGPWERLPLYFCCGCGADVAYRVDEKGEIRLLSARSREAGRYPYQPFPKMLPRIPLALDGQCPKPVAVVMNKWLQGDDLLGEELSEKESKLLDEYFGHPVNATITAYHHQLGGLPTHRSWGTDPVACPNPDCHSHPLSRLIFGRKIRYMAFLAGILNNPWGGLPFFEPKTKDTRKDWNHFEATVQFHMCPGCFTVHGCNRCT